MRRELEAGSEAASSASPRAVRIEREREAGSLESSASKLHFEGDTIPLLLPKSAQARFHLRLEGLVPRCRVASKEAFADGCAAHTGLQTLLDVKPFRRFCDKCFDCLDESTKELVVAAVEMQSDV